MGAQYYQKMKNDIVIRTRFQTTIKNRKLTDELNRL